MIAFGAVALVVNRIVAGLRGALDEKNSAPRWVWIVAAFAVGIAVAFVADVALLGGLRGGDTVARIVTGLALGGGAGVWHEGLNLASSTAKAAAAAATTKGKRPA